MPANSYILRLAIFVICILFAYHIYAQESEGDQGKWAGLGIEVSPVMGKVIKHEAKFTLPIPSITTALDVNFAWQTYGRKSWQQGRGFPTIGIGATYINYGINPVYGHCVGVYPNLQVPLIRGKKWEWTFRFGVGAAYVTKRYHNTPPIDTVNIAISTHINGFGNFHEVLRYHVNEHWDVQAGAIFTHISNGAYRHPNLGINMLGADLSLRYFFVSSKPQPIIKELPKLTNRWLTEVRLGIAYNEARTTGSPEVPTYCYNLYESKRWLGKNKFYAGVNYVYKVSAYDFLIHYGVDYGHERANAWDGAFFAGNEFLVGRVGLVAEVGYYYKQTYLAFVPYYEKIGGNLYIINRETSRMKELFISIRLLTHGIVAEYAEFGIGTGF